MELNQRITYENQNVQLFFKVISNIYDFTFPYNSIRNFYSIQSHPSAISTYNVKEMRSLMLARLKQYHDLWKDNKAKKVQNENESEMH